MSWVLVMVTVAGVFLGVVLAVAGVCYGLHAWWTHCRLARCQADDIRARVAELRLRRGYVDPSGPLPTLTPSPHRLGKEVNPR